MGEHQDKPMSREEFVEQALAEFEGPLIGYALGIVHDLERARDVVQDTFIRLYQQDRSKVERGLKTWLFTVCRNRALDTRRKEHRMKTMTEVHAAGCPSRDAAPAELLERREAAGQVLAALERLPDKQQEVLRLKFQNGLSYKEISSVTDLTVSNVGFLLHTALKTIRAKVKAADSGLPSQA